MSKSIPYISVLTAAILGAMPLTSTAASDLTLEEILVTAEKRESSLQDTPISMLAFSSERLARFGISDLEWAITTASRPKIPPLVSIWTVYTWRGVLV